MRRMKWISFSVCIRHMSHMYLKERKLLEIVKVCALLQQTKNYYNSRESKARRFTIINNIIRYILQHMRTFIAESSGR